MLPQRRRTGFEPWSIKIRTKVAGRLDRSYAQSFFGMLKHRQFKWTRSAGSSTCALLICAILLRGGSNVIRASCIPSRRQCLGEASSLGRPHNRLTHYCIRAFYVCVATRRHTRSLHVMCHGCHGVKELESCSSSSKQCCARDADEWNLAHASHHMLVTLQKHGSSGQAVFTWM
ncbi:hypothetical protein IE81DRAFT_76124 [Ceraceosorus guamensis]|uniref:Uncharacterized protein n=1 Tax=Ceraceosorus guamensis TaxID=1522189 RepID=A0A316W1T2_9BASI|nr:hypothetical protein IE81DRAFT_76124 [Ceraceosorus guamensis]PWN43484.1 hypothetical protein IE81DRAFT_76124 [Ceraceosorus guamensis]